MPKDELTTTSLSLKLFKILDKSDLSKPIHFHTPNSDTLYKYISKEDLPRDLGGYLPSVSEFMDKTLTVVNETKHIFMAEDFWKTEKKVKGAVDTGSFRTLDID